MNSCLYECQVSHARFSPRAHRFAYRVFFFALDLDELPALPRSLALFSVNRRNVYSFRDRDYLPTHEPRISGRDREAGPLDASDSPRALAPRTSSNLIGYSMSALKARVVAHLATQGIDLTGGRVVLVTLPRVFGYLFNPVSFYFCYDRAGAPVAALAEVTNTFREMKPYFLPLTPPPAHPISHLPSPISNAATPVVAFHLRAPKHFYVSPFSDVDVDFDFTLRVPAERLSIAIDDYVGPERTFTSALTGTRAPLTSGRLAWFTVKYPLITLRIIGLIHWHALLLCLKKIPWFAKAARPADQRDLYRPHASIV